jgi:peroxiredoxin
MTHADDLHQLPPDLPRPAADGACDHLPGRSLPPIALPSTGGSAIDLSAQAGRLVLYCFPRAGRPDAPNPTGWDQIPGARGCTPQSLAFRARHEEVRAQGASLFGLSTQTPSAQAEIATRLRLPFPLLSDAELAFASALDLPTFEVDGLTLIRRLTLIVADGRIEHVFYPVFPPDQNAADVLAWLQSHPR